ncbi:hypothetical protein TNCV_335411 [Trichonephila clavipes]|nr:hypothetical protein TNCV_335411 [Trichonephila clavipes]
MDQCLQIQTFPQPPILASKQLQLLVLRTRQSSSYLSIHRSSGLPLLLVFHGPTEKKLLSEYVTVIQIDYMPSPVEAAM